MTYNNNFDMVGGKVEAKGSDGAEIVERIEK
jgi:hypothetical protein